MKRLFERNKKFIVTLVCVMAIFIAAPFIFATTVYRHVLIMIMVWTIFGIGWNFLGGYAGQVSTGHAVYYAIGAYATAVGMYYWKLTPWVSMIGGMIISAVLAALIGGPLLRLKGHIFAVATMAVAESARVIFLNAKPIGAATGLTFAARDLPQWYTLQFTDKLPFYYLMLGVVFLLILLTKLVDRSKFGYYLRAIKENEISAQSVGINTAKYKLYAYILSAVVVSLGGSLYINYLQYVDPTMVLVLKVSLMICLVSVMGGTGTIWGPIVGAVVLTTISELTKARLAATLTGFDQFLYGMMVVIIVLLLPNGILSIFTPQNRNKLANFFSKGGKKNGSKG